MPKMTRPVIGPLCARTRCEKCSAPRSPNLDAIRSLLPPLTGQPAFEPALIAENISRLKTRPAIDTGHPFLDLSVKTGLAHIDATFQGDHPQIRCRYVCRW